jgi:metallo-beta-lactamase family protein
MFQGHRRESADKNRVLAVDPKKITNMILSHAHIDHSGRIPLLVKNAFAGRVVCTRATAQACEYLLADSAHIQESDAEYLNYKNVRNHLGQLKKSQGGDKDAAVQSEEIRKLLKKDRHHLNPETINSLISEHGLERIEPLYTIADAEQAMASFDGNPYRHPVSVGKRAVCTLYDAGHILGSAISIVKVQENGQTRTVCYTGDIGRFGKPIVKDPTLNFEAEDRDIDLLIMESTYGDRLHEPVVDLKPRLMAVLNETFERRGSVLIPSFAYGRTQELLYVLHELYDEGVVPRMPVYVDSPLATNITRVFGEHPEVYDRDTHETFLQQGKNPFSFDKVKFVGSVEASMALNRDETPHVVIAASGMCEAGRILHHLRFKIHNERHTVLIVGFMAAHTLGRRLLEQGAAYAESGRKGDPPMMRILNKEYPLKAHVVKLGGFSAHADKNEMLHFLKASNLNVKRIAIVHGEEDQALSFGDSLRHEGYEVVVPQVGETLRVTER